MAKKKKKSNSLVYSPKALIEVKKQLRALNWRRMLMLAISTIVAFAVFEAVLSFEEQRGLSFSIITAVYYVIVTVLIIAVIFLNHGFSKKPFTRDMIRDNVPLEEADEICLKINHHKELAKKLMSILVPFIFALLLDIIYLFYGDIFGNLVGLLNPVS